jgi:hypothetical protein
MARIESARGGYPGLFNLFKAGVMGDEKAAQAEKRALLSFIGKLPPESKPGNPASSNATWRDDRTLDALRYDVLYDLLSAEECKGVEGTIRAYVDWFKQNPGSHGSRGNAPRTGWLPNMQWPTVAGIHVLAAAGGDPDLIKQVFDTPRGWKWFFDVYIADGFYMEEFAKYPSNIGAMLLWCEGLRQLGLDEFGYGYTGKTGANMKRYLQMLMRAGFPRVERPNGMPDYPCVTMGDAGMFYVVQGYNADGSGGTPWYHSPMMWGATKMMQPLWWEAGHRRFPDAGFDYFLAQMRKPGEEIYLPTLYFGLGPIDPKKAKPPAVKSYVTPERGFTLLRAEESPAYWESPKPAVALQFGMYYVHYVHDCFSILQFVAHNRFIYNRMGAAGSGYAGGDPWRDHVRGQASGVVVDGAKVNYIDNGEEGVKNERLRQHLDGPAKFVAIRGQGLYPDVDMERSLVLTDDYLFDLYWLTSERPRVYDWHVLAPAHAVGTGQAPWKPLAQIDGEKIRGQEIKKPLLTDLFAQDAGDRPWSQVLLQSQPDADPKAADLVGVRVSMLGEPDTLIIVGRPPIGGEGFKGAGQAPLGVKLLASRTAPKTVFAALHEPFKGGLGAHRVESFERIAQAENSLAIAIKGKNGLNDRVLLSWGDAAGKPVALAGADESFGFTDFGFVRIGRDQVVATGNISELKVKVEGSPELLLNGKKTPAQVSGGVLTFGKGG